MKDRFCTNCKNYVNYSEFEFTDKYLVICPICNKEQHIDDFFKCEDETEFILKKLYSLSEKFKNITFKYKYDVLSDMHIVHVEPLEFFENNEEYINIESDFVYYFDMNYPTKNIMFISTNSLTKITEPYIIINKS